jgi:predicted metal-dependent hydrolase
MVFRDIK